MTDFSSDELEGSASGVKLQCGVITLFPELFRPFFSTSFVGKAQERGQVALSTFSLRSHGLGRHRSVDDTPYGGGSGMVIRVDCVAAAIEEAEQALGGRSHRVLLTPQGRPFRAASAHALSEYDRLLLICGRYEGFDERVRCLVDEETSLGDFVLTGGEIAAMAVIEATIRFRKGVLGNENSVHEESFSEALAGGLEYPQYTRPAEFRGLRVPEVLLSGDHGRIAEWRQKASQQRTKARRPDLQGDSS